MKPVAELHELWLAEVKAKDEAERKRLENIKAEWFSRIEMLLEARKGDLFTSGIYLSFDLRHAATADDLNEVLPQLDADLAHFGYSIEKGDQPREFIIRPLAFGSP